MAAPVKRKELSSALRTYLLAYNGVMAAAWVVLLVKVVRYCLSHSMVEEGWRVPGLYQELRWTLLVFQTPAFLEVVHSMVGIVPSPVLTVFLQQYGRIFITWALMEGTPGVSDNGGLVLVMLAWSLTEVVRYPYYFCSLLGSVPYIIMWCRFANRVWYTLFYILYPVGILGELLLFFEALPVVQARGQWTLSLPNKLNIGFSFYYFLCFSVSLYIPLFPQVYGHMIRQRRKNIGGEKTKLE